MEKKKDITMLRVLALEASIALDDLYNAWEDADCKDEYVSRGVKWKSSYRMRKFIDAAEKMGLSNREAVEVLNSVGKGPRDNSGTEND